MGFTLDREEQNKLVQWLTDHDNFCKLYDDGSKPVSPQGAIGGRLTYSFTPNGVGMVTVVTCACGASIDLTDYKAW